MSYAIIETLTSGQQTIISMIESKDQFHHSLISTLSLEQDTVKAIDKADMPNGQFLNLRKGIVTLYETSDAKSSNYLWQSNYKKHDKIATYSLMPIDLKSKEIHLSFYESPLPVSFRKFNLTDLGSNSTFAIIGRKGSGKTYRTVNYVKKLPQHVQEKTIIFTNEFASTRADQYKKDLPHSKVVVGFDTDELNQFLDAVKKAKNKQVKLFGDDHILNKLRNGVVVFDDTFLHSNNLKNDAILDVLDNGKDYGLTVVVNMQWPLGLPPYVRSKFDYVFLLNEPFGSTQKKLWEQYAGVFEEYDDFKISFKELTPGFQAMVINNNTDSYELSDHIMWHI